uniref:Intercellular adhesion molecule 1-like n=1 Tax=Pundamilia nyererei TaxID=303518 RepID=A0A3B4G4U4_9CICH
MDAFITSKYMFASCSLQISPPRVVVRFGDSFSANCTSSSDQTNGMGWESTHQGVDLTQGVTSLPFKIDSVPEWKMEPMCYVNSRDGDQCTKTLPVTVYKMPDSVSLNYSLTKVEEGQKYYIQCDIANVAPARNLSVLWLKGNTIIKLETFNESSLSPVSKSSVLTLTAHRDDDGAEIWCEPKLNLWPEEQGPPSGPPVRSVKHNLTVLCTPVQSSCCLISTLTCHTCEVGMDYLSKGEVLTNSVYVLIVYNILCCDSPLGKQQCNNISHLPQGLEQPLESWWEWVWLSEFCSSLLVHILWHLMERSLSTKAAINQELPQDQYKADFFLNSDLHGYYFNFC